MGQFAMLKRDKRRGRRRGKHDTLYRRDLRPLLLLMIPLVLLILVIDLVPIAIALINSFRLLAFSTLAHWVEAPWIGTRNYVEAVTGGGGLSISALQATWQSLAFSVLTTVISLPVGVLAAMTVVRRTSRSTRLIRVLYILPFALPLFSTAYLWRMILLPGTGLLDGLRKVLGLGDTANRFLLGDHSFLVFVFVDLWFAWGFIYLFALAGQQNIPIELYEAADIEGANWWQKFRYVTYPGIRRLLAVATVLSIVNHYNDFTLPYVLFGQSPPPEVNVLPVLTYEAGFSVYNFGLADAIAVIGLLTILVPIIIYIWMIFRKGSE